MFIQENLSKEAEDQYEEKLCVVKGLDLFKPPSKEWSADPDMPPAQTVSDIDIYLVFGMSANSSKLLSHMQFTKESVHDLQIRTTVSTILR